jgi:hypothetical protein
MSTCRVPQDNQPLSEQLPRRVESGKSVSIGSWPSAARLTYAAVLEIGGHDPLARQRSAQMTRM